MIGMAARTGWQEADKRRARCQERALKARQELEAEPVNLAVIRSPLTRERCSIGDVTRNSSGKGHRYSGKVVLYG